MSEKLRLPERLILVRHGESLHNAVLRCKASKEMLDEYHELVRNSDSPDHEYPLTELGEKQAEMAHIALLRDDESADILENEIRVHSQFFRTEQTAEKLSGGNMTGWEKSDLLGEREYGPFGVSDRSDDTAEKRFLWQQYRTDYWGTDFGGQGESIEDVVARNRESLSRVAGKGAIFSTHGDWIRGMIHVIEGTDPKKLTPKTEEIPILNGVILEYGAANGKLFRRHQYPDTNDKPLPEGTGKWSKVDINSYYFRNNQFL